MPIRRRKARPGWFVDELLPTGRVQRQFRLKQAAEEFQRKLLRQKDDQLAGAEGRVAYEGTMVDIVHQLVGGVRAAMGYTGSHDIDTMRTRPKFVKITSAGMRESHVHDVTITKEAPNYRSSS